MFAQEIDGSMIAQSLISSYTGIEISGTGIEISGSWLANDGTLAVMAALLLGAREDNPDFKVCFVEEAAAEETEAGVWRSVEENDADLTVAFCPSEAIADRSAELLIERHPDLGAIPLLERFFHARSHVRFLEYRCGEGRAKYAVLLKEDIRIWHMALSVLPRLLPGFDPTTLTEDEIALCNACLERNPKPFVTAAERLKENPRIRRHVMSFTLDRMNKRVRESKIKSLQSNIKGIEGSIQRLTNELSNYWRSKRDLEERIWMIQTSDQQDDSISKLMQMLTGNRDIEIPDDSITENGFTVAIRSRLMNFPDIQAAIDRNDSIIYNIPSPLSAEDRRRLMNALFVDEKYQIEVYGSFFIDLCNRELYAHRYSSGVPKDWMKSAIPNPHLHYFSCVGSYQQEMTVAMQTGEYQQAVAVCSSSVASVNLHEFVSFQRLLSDLMGDEKKLAIASLRRPDGTSLTPMEAIQELKQAETSAEGE